MMSERLGESGPMCNVFDASEVYYFYYFYIADLLLHRVDFVDSGRFCRITLLYFLPNPSSIIILNAPPPLAQHVPKTPKN